MKRTHDRRARVKSVPDGCQDSSPITSALTSDPLSSLAGVVQVRVQPQTAFMKLERVSTVYCRQFTAYPQSPAATMLTYSH
ncbi:hypothetical protein QQF64_022508 [Cirrhinus molitorella]|uniref:Uncharacterized protein n=1 Tax=Cirrhinus molitorella TaxID=172907 RepID=A0ABR3L2U7_9TELE